MMAQTRARSRDRGRTTTHRHQDGWLIFTRPEQHWFFRLLGLVVRFRAELTLITVTVIVHRYAATHFGVVFVSVTGLPPVSVDFSDPTVITIVLGSTLAVLAGIPATRRYIYARVWCVITRHRVRACMVQTRTMARVNGRLPFLLWARPSPVGEHLTVWLPAGLSVNDLDRIRPQLAAACYAKDCRVTAWGWKAMLIDVHIVRYDPLGTRLVPTDLTTDTNEVDTDETTDTADSPGTAGGTPDRKLALVSLTPALRRPTTTDTTDTGTDSGDDDDPEPDQPAAAPRRVPAPRKPSDPTTTTGTASNDGSAVTGYGGADVSDYI